MSSLFACGPFHLIVPNASEVRLFEALCVALGWSHPWSPSWKKHAAGQNLDFYLLSARLTAAARMVESWDLEARARLGPIKLLHFFTACPRRKVFDPN